MNIDFKTRFSHAIKCDVCPVINRTHVTVLNVFVTLKVPTRIGCFQHSKGNKRSYIPLTFYNVIATVTELCIIMCGFHVKNESRL